MHAKAEEILAFWLDEVGPEGWYEGGETLDARCRRFEADWERGVRGDFAQWTVEPRGALALTILLDQFPRNMFRGSPRAFATDAQAVEVAERAIARGFDEAYQPPEKRFFYMPFMHSEGLEDQERCIALCAAADDADGVKYAEIHRDIIRDFGRFPHRNPVLGRETTAQERAFLDEGGFSG